MTKQATIACVYSMHRHGICQWASEAVVMEAFAKCGISWQGIDTELLTLNPQVTNAPNQPVTDTRYASAQVPTPAIPAPVELRPFVTPPTVREGSTAHYKSMGEHYKQESTSLQLNPQLISDLQVESIQPTASEMAMAGALMNELTNPEERRQRTRKKLNYKDDGSQNVMTVTGMLSRNTELRAQLTVQRQEREEAATNKATKLDTSLALRDQYLKCKSGGLCSCGEEPCVAKKYEYCRQCDIDGRNPVQKSKCKKQTCAQGKIQAGGASSSVPPAVPPPATAVTLAADAAGSADILSTISGTQARLAVAMVLGAVPHQPRVAFDDDFVWTFAGLRDGESIFKHRFRKDPNTQEHCMVTQANLPKGAKVQYPQNRAKRRRDDDRG